MDTLHTSTSVCEPNPCPCSPLDLDINYTEFKLHSAASSPFNSGLLSRVKFVLNSYECIEKPIPRPHRSQHVYYLSFWRNFAPSQSKTIKTINLPLVNGQYENKQKVTPRAKKKKKQQMKTMSWTKQKKNKEQPIHLHPIGFLSGCHQNKPIARMFI